MELNNIQGITDSRLIAKLQSLSQDIVANEFDFKTEWVCQNRWIVVPTESALTAKDEEWWSNACASFGYMEFYAIITEPNPNNFPCYIVQANKQGIYEMDYECSANHHLLMPEDQGFAILRPFGLYSLIAGPKPFVEMAVGSTIETARETFREFAGDTAWQENDRSFLLGIAERYTRLSRNVRV